MAEWDSGDARYWSYVPDRPEESRLYFLSPNQGYWVSVTDTVTLAPALVVLAPVDEDLPPLQSDPIATRGGPWAPGPEDTESSPSGVTAVFDSAATQGWLRVRRHEVALQLPLRNNGGGALGWSAELRPFTGAVPEGAVALDSAASVDDVLSLSARRGVLSTRTQVLEVAVNRTHLPPATYLAELSIRPSAGDGRRFLVAIEAGGLEGQWEGLISIDTVNGRRNAVPDIDVHLHISADTLDGSRLLRGFIDSRETSLWPSDASFVGQMLEPRRLPRWREGYRRRFVLEGDVTLAPGRSQPLSVRPVSCSRCRGDARSDRSGDGSALPDERRGRSPLSHAARSRPPRGLRESYAVVHRPPLSVPGWGPRVERYSTSAGAVPAPGAPRWTATFPSSVANTSRP